MPKTFLLVLDLFIGLIDRRLLFLTKYIGEGDVGGFILPKVLIFFFCRSVTWKILSVNILYTREQLQQCFCFCINGFFNHFILSVQFLTLRIQLDSDRCLQVFLEVLNQDILIRSFNRVKFSQGRLQVLRVFSSVEKFFQLVIEISLDLYPIAIYKRLEISLVSAKKDPKLISSDLNGTIYIMFLLVQLPLEVDAVLK